MLANYDDRTLLRNYVALQLSQMFGMTYTPRSQFVELVLNGQYVGNYQLIEEIDIDNNRLNITSMKDNDTSGAKLTGGYLIEGDNKLEDSTHMRFATNLLHNSFIIHEPSDSITQQTNYISNYMSTAERALYGSNFTDPANGYRKYLNPVTFAQYFWVNEFSRNNDAGFWSSTFLYKDKDSLLNMGPVWDFDIAFGNTTFNSNQNPQGWWIANQTWFNRLLQDSAFTNIVISQWKTMRNSLNSLNGIINNMAANLQQSEIQNFKVWSITASLPQGFSSETAGSYQGEINFLENWITQRLSWVDANLQSLYIARQSSQ